MCVPAVPVTVSLEIGEQDAQDLKSPSPASLTTFKRPAGPKTVQIETEVDVRLGTREPDSAVGLRADSSSLSSLDCKRLLCLFLCRTICLPTASLGLDPTDALVLLRYSL